MQDETLLPLLSAIGRIAVIAGGSSAERPVTLKRGQAVFDALESLGVDAQLVDPSEQDIDALRQFDLCFIALHGRGGEDGVIQGVLEYLGIRYTGSAVMASAIGMDKVKTKMLWCAASLPTPEFYVAGRNDRPLPFPLMVKPAHEGSSIGMRKVDSAEQLSAAIAEAEKFDTQVLVEQWVQGAEFTVAILGDQALPAFRLETPSSFYAYEAKYQANPTRYLCPCGLSAGKEQELKTLGLNAFLEVGCRYWGRVDLMQDADGGFYLLEVNTVPGMTDHSLVPMAANAAGYSFAELVAEILLSAGGRA